MKAKEAPEEIYRTTFYLDDDKGDTKWKKTPVAGAENIEYIRKDAFIEKARKWFNSKNGIIITDTKAFFEEFIDYMGIE